VKKAPSPDGGTWTRQWMPQESRRVQMANWRGWDRWGRYAAWSEFDNRQCAAPLYER